MSTIATAILHLDKVTKGAVLYKVGEAASVSPAITSIYLRKDGLTEPYPTSIVMTIVKQNDDI